MERQRRRSRFVLPQTTRWHFAAKFLCCLPLLYSLCHTHAISQASPAVYFIKQNYLVILRLIILYPHLPFYSAFVLAFVECVN